LTNAAEGARFALSLQKENTLAQEVRTAAFFHQGLSFSEFLEFVRKRFPEETTHGGHQWTASVSWGYEFIHRHNLILHRPHAAVPLTFDELKTLFASVWSLLDEVVSTYSLSPSTIFNLDESRVAGVEDDLLRSHRVLAGRHDRVAVAKHSVQKTPTVCSLMCAGGGFARAVILHPVKTTPAAEKVTAWNESVGKKYLPALHLPGGEQRQHETRAVP
jgi:hypothetical protein